MQVYGCKVRLGGEIANEVPKTEATAAEIILLRRVHGPDAVVAIKSHRSDRRAHAGERQRLERLYGKKAVVEMFGQAHQDLPVKLPDGELDQFGVDAEVTNQAPMDDDVRKRLAELEAENAALKSDLEGATAPKRKAG